MAARLELGAVNAYIGFIPSFADRQLSKVAARLAPMKPCTTPCGPKYSAVLYRRMYCLLAAEVKGGESGSGAR